MISADPVKQAKINEAINDVAEPNVKVRYWPLTVAYGQPESAEGLKEALDSLQTGTTLMSHSSGILIQGLRPV